VKEINPSEITPEHLYLSRRKFLAGAGMLAAGALASACGVGGAEPPAGSAAAQPTSAEQQPQDQLTPYESVIGYNNFYEFSLDKEDVGDLSKGFQTSPWTVQVGGLVNRPGTYGIEELLKRFPPEERIYRFRCVEAWSMVIPFLGFPLARLLKEVEPTPSAKYVRFETLYDPTRMPGQRNRQFRWPYVEGLRLDEAMHDLTMLSTGVYGKPALPQNGAPLRLVVPWKYAFKDIKSIVKIDLVEEMPVSMWMALAPNEYGFYANVNPEVNHPRWSQGSERRIGESGRRKTLMFNGYGEEVASLYAGMDLRKLY